MIFIAQNQKQLQVFKRVVCWRLCVCKRTSCFNNNSITTILNDWLIDYQWLPFARVLLLLSRKSPWSRWFFFYFFFVRVCISFALSALMWALRHHHRWIFLKNFWYFSCLYNNNNNYTSWRVSRNHNNNDNEKEKKFVDRKKNTFSWQCHRLETTSLAQLANSKKNVTIWLTKNIHDKKK